MKFLGSLLVVLLAVVSLQAAPKRLLVVTTTTGFRHSSIPTAEKILSQLAESSGEFTVDFVHQPPGKPDGLPKDATDAQKADYAAAEAKVGADLAGRAAKTCRPPRSANYDGVAFVSTTGDLPDSG